MLLLDALDAVRRSEVDRALATIASLVERKPEFRLAQLVYADLLAARSRPLAAFGDFPGANDEALAALRREALARLRHARQAPASVALPSQLLRVSESQLRAIVVDVRDSRLYFYVNRRNGLRLVADYYVSTGKNGVRKQRQGDHKTPLGVYFLTGRVKGGLPDFYGAGALPIDYPNEWDRRLGRTGYGIWIHGVPRSVYSRPPRSSDGCMVLANDDLGVLWDNLPGDNAPVVIVDGVVWQTREALAERADAFLGGVEAWRRDWESRDADRYAAHYSTDFRSDRWGDRAAWVRQKRRVMASTPRIDVDLSDISALAYPGEDRLVVVTFTETYRSGGFTARTRKRQYWKREDDGRWRIVYEGGVRLLEEHLKGIPYSARMKTYASTD